MVIFDDPWHSHLLPSVLTVNLSLPVFTTKVCRSWDSSTQTSACRANALAHCANTAAFKMLMLHVCNNFFRKIMKNFVINFCRKKIMSIHVKFGEIIFFLNLCTFINLGAYLQFLNPVYFVKIQRPELLCTEFIIYMCRLLQNTPSKFLPFQR